MAFRTILKHHVIIVAALLEHRNITKASKGDMGTFYVIDNLVVQWKIRT
jgi:hypothetical protein